MRFERAYTTQPVCQPARAAIFTGMYPHSSGSWTNSVALSADTHTIGERLRQQDIATAYIGKWHLDGGDYFGLGRCPAGWDKEYWYDMRNYLDELTPEERRLSRQSASMLERDFPAEFTYARRCSDRAIDYIGSHEDQDYFLALSYDEPHDPSLCPREYWEMYEDYCFPAPPNVRDDLQGKPDYQRIWAGGRQNEDRSAVKVRQPFFFGCNSFVDAEIGRVTEAIRRHAPDAYIIYTSDHGDFLESHCLTGKGPAAYEEITHIPLFISGGGIAPGSVSGAPVSHINLAPTIFEMFGLLKPVLFQGDSILGQATGERERVNDCCFMEFGRYEIDHDGFGAFQPLRAVTDGRYKLSVNLLSQDELYDLETDPHEMDNLIGKPEYRETAVRLHDRLLQNMNETRDPFRGHYWEYRPWRQVSEPPAWSYTGYTRQSENDFEKRQLDYATGLEMEEAVRRK